MNKGWSGAHKTRDQAGSFAASFQLEKDTTYVIRFLEDEPYASYRQHWLERQGKKSYVCPEDPDDPKSPRCPLCDNGAEIRAQYAFNIVLLEERQKPRILSWEMGVRLMQKLERINKDEKIGPLSEPYFAVTRTGKGTASDTQLSPIKARDLWDDYGIEELTDKEFDSLFKKRYDPSIVQIPPMSTLRDLAKEMTKYDG